MRAPGVSLCGLLWLWLPLAWGRPVKLEKVQADTRSLARTLGTRIQELQLTPAGSVKVWGAEAAAGERAPEGLWALGERLAGVQRALAGPAAGSAPLAQVASDTENLRSLVGALGRLRGCAPPRGAGAGAAGAPGLPELLAAAPYTAAALALRRLRACLDALARLLDGPAGC
ncbi:leptin [Eudromia elegans]